MNRNRMLAGLSLVVVGLVLLWLQLMDDVRAPVPLLVIGSLLIAGYLMRRAYGLLVAGCIVLGIALGQVAEQVVSGISNAGGIGLGAGFLAIYVVDRAHSRSAHWWPLIPGTILVVSGVATITSIGDYVWPVVLIAVGLGLMFGFTRRRSSKPTASSPTDIPAPADARADDQPMED